MPTEEIHITMIPNIHQEQMRNEEKRTNQLRTGACLLFFFNVFFFSFEAQLDGWPSRNQPMADREKIVNTK